MNLAQQLLEPFVFGNPRLNLGDQIFGDIGGSGFVAGPFAGDVLAAVSGAAVLAAAGRPAAALGVAVQGGGQHRRRGGELLEPAGEHSANERGVIGDAHDRARNRRA